MEKINRGTLKKSLIICVFITALSVSIFSIFTIYICFRIQNYILPSSDIATLNITTTYEDGSQQVITQKMEFGEAAEVSQITADDVELKSGIPIQRYTIDKIDYGINTLTPQNRFFYISLSVLMVLLPLLYAISGILFCGLWFYKKKLSSPIQTLNDAVKQIEQENLDFVIESRDNNELGDLCLSFERMRKALYTNNKQLLSMLEDRRMLQASLAHDLRNPIAMIIGYAQYLQQNIHHESMTKEKISHMISNIESASKRLEYYTDSIQNIYKIEDLEIHKQEIRLPHQLNEVMEEFVLLAKNSHINIMFENHIQDCTKMLDVAVLYRVLENVIRNALRYAHSCIQIHSDIEKDYLKIIIKDDGKGFDESILHAKNKYSFHYHSEDQHMGVGLIISEILCKKHGGDFRYGNDENGGAVVVLTFFCK